MGAKRAKAVRIYPTYPPSSSSPEPRGRSSRTTAPSSSSSTRDSRPDHPKPHAAKALGEQGIKLLGRRSPSPSSSEASFSDEIVLVAPRPHLRPSLSSTAPLAHPLPPPAASLEQRRPVLAEQASPASATRRRWPLDLPVPPADPRPLSDKAKGKLPLEGERAVQPPPRSESPRPAREPKRRRLDTASGGAELHVASSTSSRMIAERERVPTHRRRTASSAAASSASSRSSPEHVEAADQASREVRNGGSPEVESEVDQGTLSPALPGAAALSAYSASGQQSGAWRTSSLTPAESSPPQPDAIVQSARSSTASDAGSHGTVTARSPSAADVASSRPAAPVARLTASTFPSRSPRHPLNTLRFHPPPSDPPPRFIFNDAFAPAVDLGWVRGAAPKKRAPARPPPRPRLAPPPAVAVPAPAPAVVVDGNQRRSGRAKTQAQLACSIYPSAAERIAMLAASTSASGPSSRSSSASVEDARTRPISAVARAAPLVAAKPVRPKSVMAKLRLRYAFLAEAECAPFRSDNSLAGINPEPCSFEWDDDEVRAAVRAEGWPRWTNADFEMERDAGEAAELVLRAREGDEAARDEVRAACQLTSWRFLGLDEALGGASNAATGWATRDWRMVQRQRELGEGLGVDTVDVGDDPQAFLDALNGDGDFDLDDNRSALEPSSSLSPLPPTPRKRGSAITDVPPSTPHAPVAVIEVADRRHDSLLEEGPSADPPRQIVVSDSNSSNAHPDDMRSAQDAIRSASRERAVSTASAASSPSSAMVVTPSRQAAPAPPAASHARAPSASRAAAAAAARPHARAGSSSSAVADVAVVQSEMEEDSSSSSPGALAASSTSATSSAALDSTATATRGARQFSGSDERSATPPRRRARDDSGDDTASPEPAKRPRKPRGKRRTARRGALGKFVPSAAPARRSSASSSSPDNSSTSGSTKPLSPERLSPSFDAERKPRPSARKPDDAAARASSTSSSDSSPAAPDLAPAPPSPPPAPVKRAPVSPAAPLKPGYKRCEWEDCPNPAYKSTTATSDALHVANYHESSCVITYQRPYRTQRLERDEQGLFDCPWCRHKVKNATVARSHAYGRKGCPGPPVVKEDKASS
ncbi:hypothetical protein JCM9279_002013 [Rhodotorula babjevae]